MPPSNLARQTHTHKAASRTQLTEASPCTCFVLTPLFEQHRCLIVGTVHGAR